MLLIRVVVPEGYEGEPPVYPYSGDDIEGVTKKIMSFYEDNPVAFMGADKIDVVRVTGEEFVKRIDLPEPDFAKLAEGIVRLIGRKTKS